MSNCNENMEDSEIPMFTNDDVGEEVDSVHLQQTDDDLDTNIPMPNNTDVNPDYINFGKPECVCPDCGAMMWYGERVEKEYNATKPTFSMCCRQGRIVIAPWPNLPQPLYELYYNNDSRSNFFLENIRAFNSMFSFTSMGGKTDNTFNSGRAPTIFTMNGENYHQIRSLLPLEGKDAKFAQLCIYDTDNEVKNRMAVVRMIDDNEAMRSTMVDHLRQILDSCNPFIKQYRNVRDKLKEQNVPTIRLRILGKRNCDDRRYNLPTASEVAALIVGDFDASDFVRDIVVEEKFGLLKRVSIIQPNYFPLQYLLLFPRGEDGYRTDIEYIIKVKNSALKRKYVTQLEWLAYKIQYRECSPSTILFARRLFQQFLVDAYSMIEYARISYARNNQKKLRADMYRGLTEACLRGETDSSIVGKRVVLPATFVGGPRYMMLNYQDAMAIWGWIGYPDLFITFTCNHKWPELTEFLRLHNLTPADRPDLSSRIFKG